MKKRTITLEDGTIVDCGVKEFDDMLKAIQEGDSKAVVGASVKVLLSSDAMMNKLVKEITKGFKLVGELHRLEEIDFLRNKFKLIQSNAGK